MGHEGVRQRGQARGRVLPRPSSGLRHLPLGQRRLLRGGLGGTVRVWTVRKPRVSEPDRGGAFDFFFFCSLSWKQCRVPPNKVLCLPKSGYVGFGTGFYKRPCWFYSLLSLSLLLSTHPFCLTPPSLSLSLSLFAGLVSSLATPPIPDALCSGTEGRAVRVGHVHVREPGGLRRCLGERPQAR